MMSKQDIEAAKKYGNAIRVQRLVAEKGLDEAARILVKERTEARITKALTYGR